MRAFSLVIAVATFAVSANAGVVIQEEHPINWYDCSGKADGNYVHPYDCNRFISCSGGIASQRDCADCNIDPVRCPDGRLVYDPSVDSCEWADTTTCSASPRPSTELPTQPPTVVPSSERPSSTTTEASSSTSDDSGSTQQPPSTTTEDPNEGDLCDPKKCINKGFCQWYWTCNNATSRWERRECDADLVWNPLNPDGTNHQHGGNCDLRGNILPITENEYAESKECFACFWEEIGKCNADYRYQAPFLTNRNVQTLTCATSLVFDEAKLTCVKCENAKKSDGSACNC